MLGGKRSGGARVGVGDRAVEASLRGHGLSAHVLDVLVDGVEIRLVAAELHAQNHFG
jgi:hypothetical protein